MNSGTIIKKVQVTEKGTTLAEKQRKYFLVVEPSATKVDIRHAVESAFKVKVEKVNTLNCMGKSKRGRNMRYGRTPDWKRAVVTLKEGNKIELA